MAKTLGRTRKVTTRRKAAPRQRVSTRHVATVEATRTTGTPRTGRPARAARGTARAADAVQVRFRLTDVSGAMLRDPATFFTFRRLDDNRQVGDQLQVALDGRAVQFALPSSPEVHVCEIDPERYRFARSPVFFATPGASVDETLCLWREPLAWTPRFTPWDDLPRSFAPLKTVLRASPDVTFFDRARPGRLVAPRLVGKAWDDLAGAEATLARTALLNLFYRLDSVAEPIGRERTWFSFVRRIVAIGRERLLALVDPEMLRLVSHVREHLDHFASDYEATPAGNHRPNVPPDLQAEIVDMISLKSTHRKGNFQLTLTRVRTMDEVLLDADIDESGDLLGHCLDLFKHKRTGGTHPHDIHEILVHQDGALPGFDLGYRLV